MSDKPLGQRLQVRGERRLAVVDAPAGLDAAIDAPRADLAAADVVLLFTHDRAAFDAGLARTLPQLAGAAILWVAYPKLTSPLAADLSRDIIHAAAPSHGLDPVAQIAVDADWSALRLKRLG